MRDIAIYGAGGLGKEVLTIINAINKVSPAYNFIGYFDDTKAGERIVGGISALNQWKAPLSLIVAIGAPKIKKSIIQSIVNPQVKYEIIIHPQAIIGDLEKVIIRKGAVIAAGSILTTDIEIGEHVLINLNTTIGHDSTVGDFTSIMPGVNVAGGVHIESSVLIGSGVNIINAVTIESNAIVGAGAVVIKDVRKSTTVVGVPAKEKP